MASRIAPDKKRHFYVGILMGLVLQALSLYVVPTLPFQATMLALGIVIAISYGFELFSKFTGHGVYDFMDAVASVLGGIAGMAIAFVTWYIRPEWFN